MRVVDVTN